MKAPVAALCLRCVCWPLFFVFPVAGKPLQSDAPGPTLFASPGQDVVLPCGSGSRGAVVEWAKVDGGSEVTLYAERDGHELVREKATRYLDRTTATGDGSVKLLGVTRQDSGTYRCVIHVDASTAEEATVTLVVGEVPDVSLLLWRTPANRLLLSCESSGWSRRPRMSLLSANGTELAARPTVSVAPDGLFSVRAELDAAAAGGNMTIVCRVEIPGTSLMTENHVHITDEFLPPDPDGSSLLLPVISSVAVVLALALVVVVLLVPLEMMEKQRSWLGRQIGYRRVSARDTSASSSSVNQLLINEYGDITQVSTSGFSGSVTVDGRSLTGVEASRELAREDLPRLLTYKDQLIRVGNRLQVHPAVIAAIASRQSRFGAELRVTGYGQWDDSSFGLMQINRRYHAIKGGAYSEEHLDQGVTFLIQLLKTVERNKQHWTKEQRLKGALACYVAGPEAVLPLEYEDLDTVTPHKDFASDVVARAQWFAQNAF